MKTEKKLYRVDINLKYLVYTDTKEKYNQSQVFDWLKQEMHEGELDEVCNITSVNHLDIK